MITLSTSSGRLQARARSACRQARPSVPHSSRPICLRQLQRRRVDVAATGPGLNDDSSSGRFDDRSTGETPDMNPEAGCLREQQTGKLPHGPADVGVGDDVESSDTYPALDPSEQPKISDREGSGTNEARTQFRTSEQEFTPVGVRDQSDKASGQGSGGGAHMAEGEAQADEKRSHPVARTAGTAIGSTVGTVLGAVGGPVGAAAGAALGASAGRGLTDLLSGSKEQGDIYEQGAEPEQVAEEVMSVTDNVKDAACSAAEKVNERTEHALDRAEDALHKAEARADERRREGQSRASAVGDEARSMADEARNKVQEEADHMSNKAHQASSELKERSRSDESSGKTEGGGGGSHHHGLGASIKDAAKAAVDKVESIPFPQFSPATEDAEGQEGQEGSGEAPQSASTKAEDVQAGDRAAEAGWGAQQAAGGKASSSEWVGDWGSDAATSAAASQGLSGQGSTGQGAGGSGLGGLGDAEAVVKADVGSPSVMVQGGMDMASAASAEGWKPDMVGRAGGVAAAGGYGGGSDSSMGDVGFKADQERASGGASMQPVSAVGNAGQEIRGSGGNISGGVGAEFGERADFEAGGGVLDGVAGRVLGIEEALGDITLDAVAGASYEGMGGMGFAGQGFAGQENPVAQANASRAGGEGASEVQGVPEGRLAAGGDDAQAAVGVEGGSVGAATSDSTAERVAQVYNVGADASPGAAEAEQYRAEAEQEGGKGDKGQSA